MNGTDRANIFLSNFSTLPNDLESYIKYCTEHTHNRDAETIVISTSLLEVLYEVEEYLEYFEQNILKKILVDYSVEGEWDRIYQNVFREFLDTLQNEANYDTVDKRLTIISKLISNWKNLPKDKIPPTTRNR